MIQEFVDRFMAEKPALLQRFKASHPAGYTDIVKAVIEAVTDPDGYSDSPDPERITVVDDGDYQGTLVYVIASKGYQPWNYWYVKVGYGSCSGCDTLQSISGYSDEPPTDEQAKDYLGLALNVVQGLKAMQEEND